MPIVIPYSKKPRFNVNIAIKVFSRKYSFPHHLFGFPAPNKRNIVIYDESHNDFDFLYIKITYFWLGMLEIIFELTMITTAKEFCNSGRGLSAAI